MVDLGTLAPDTPSTRHWSLAEDTSTCDRRRPTVIGTHGDDVLDGTLGADVVVAGARDDRIATGGGKRSRLRRRRR
jgi:hypothetical protein